VEEEGWLEVKPLPTANLKAGNMAAILDMLHSNGKPFRCFILDCDGENGGNVRFFLQIKDRNAYETVYRTLPALLEVEVVRADPPRKVYPLYCDIELKRHYALPICNLDEKPHSNPIDILVGALAGTGCAVEVTACADNGAVKGILRFIGKRSDVTGSFSRSLLDTVIGIFKSMVGMGSAGEPRGRSPQRKLGAHARMELEEAYRKRLKNLFVCNIRVYGDSQLKVKKVMDAMPKGMNSFKVYKTVRKATEAPETLAKPGRNVLRNSLTRALRLTPLAIATAYITFEIIARAPSLQALLSNPLLLPKETLTATLLIASALTIILHILVKVKRPIVLATEELSLLVSLPSAVGRLPLEYGATRPSGPSLPPS